MIIFYIIFFTFPFLLFLFFSYIFISFFFNMVLPTVFGGPFFAKSPDKKIEKMIALANISQQEKVVDLGAGDGKILIALAQKGIESHGYEINPLLVWKARRKIQKLSLQKKAFMHWGDFWKADISGFDVIIIYGISFAMKGLEEKIKKEAKNNARIVCNYFHFPSWMPTIKEEDVYLYKK